MSSTITNWTKDSIWLARNHAVTLRDGTECRVTLDTGGWSVGSHTNLDIWSACRVLNDAEARFEQPEATFTGTPADFSYDPGSHFYWLDFGGFPGEEWHALLKSEGWRWSSYRNAYRNNRRFSKPPAGIPYQDVGEANYSDERADRLRERADKHEVKAASARKRSDDLVSMIPFGQPILVGHHSEGADRRRRERSWNLMGKYVAESKTAERLDAAADRSERRAARKATPEKMQARVERLEADYRKMTRYLEERTREILAGKSEMTGHDAEYRRRASLVLSEIEQLKASIADAGGIKADKETFEVGDTILIHNFRGVVLKINKKTIKVDCRPNSMSGPWPMNLERHWFQRVLVRKNGQPVEEAETGEGK